MVMGYKEATELRQKQMHALIVLWIFALLFIHFCYTVSIARAFKTKYPWSTYRNYNSYC